MFPTVFTIKTFLDMQKMFSVHQMQIIKCASTILTISSMPKTIKKLKGTSTLKRNLDVDVSGACQKKFEVSIFVNILNKLNFPPPARNVNPC